MSFLSSFLGQGSKEDRDTHDLISQVKKLQAGSDIGTDDGNVKFLMQVMEEAGSTCDVAVGHRIGGPVFDFITMLFVYEPFVVSIDKVVGDLGLAEAAQYRKDLRRAIRMLSNEARYLSKWKGVASSILAVLYAELPEQVFVDPDVDGQFEEYSRLAPVLPLYEFIKDLPVFIHKIIATIFADDLMDDELFDHVREQLLINLAQASNIPFEDRHLGKKPYVLPEDKKGLDDLQLVSLYLRDTPFLSLFLIELPLYIPEAVRFEHTHVLAGTGHGKTQTLQFLIAGDLEEAIKQRRSLVVMDSQGDLLQTLMHSPYFENENLRDRFIYVNPEDLTCPVGLNLFDVDLSPGGHVSAVAQETILNNTVELYDFFFGALLGAELTQKQGLVFRYLAVLMMRIPGANVHTLRELMEDGEKFRPYMKKLGGSARTFFETRFFDRSFNETKKQILNRLWGVLSNQTLDRMMSAPKNTIDLYSALQNGSIVFINTAKDFFGEEGSAIFSRMFVTLLGQALMRRAAIEKHERTPTYIYIDEAERVVDTTLARMLAQVRKYKGAITFAHQNLDQLEASVRAGVLANTSIKLAGGVSAKDAHALASDFRCDSNFLLSQKKSKRATQFACFARNVTEKAVSLTVPLGYLESQGTLSEREFDALIESSRQKYGIAFVEPEPLVPDAPDSPTDWMTAPSGVDEPDTLPTPLEAPALTAPPLEKASSPVPPVAEIAITRLEPLPVPAGLSEMGGGGAKHKYLEHLIKELGEERNFRASVEESVHDGAGRVDVILRRQELSFAFEISVTTTRDHELGNVEKCLALPFTHVVVLASHKRHLRSLSMHIGQALEDGEKKRVSFLLPEDLPGFLDGYPQVQAPKEKTVKGYTVRTRVKAADPEESIARRRAIAQVVARSLQQ